MGIWGRFVHQFVEGGIFRNLFVEQEKYPPPSPGEGLSVDVIYWGKKYEKEEEKRGINVTEKGRKGKWKKENWK